jgi:hypothetical protein
MLRLFPISFLCAIFLACSSNDADVLEEWLGSQGISAAYSKKYVEIPLSVKSKGACYNSSAYMVSSFAAFGKANGIEQSLYFGLTAASDLGSEWKLRTDSIFYADIYKGVFPPEQNEIKAEIYWLIETEYQPDNSLWLNGLPATEFPPGNSAGITLKRKAGSSRDTFFVELPDELLNAVNPITEDTHLLVRISPVNDGAVLRLSPPNVLDISGLQRVAQKPEILDDDACNGQNLYLYSGIRDSLNVAFKWENEAEAKRAIGGRTVVFAQLALDLSNPNESINGSELEFPIPVYIYTAGALETYRIDEETVTDKDGNGHPNIIFGESDELLLQVTRGLRRDSLAFTLRLAEPMLNHKSYYYYNSIYSLEKILSDRPAYARYDFGPVLEKGAKLRLWLADYGDGKK